MMKYEDFASVLTQLSNQNGLKALSEQQIRKLYDFNLYLLEYNEHTNLTAIRTLEEVIFKHDIDSLTVENRIPEGQKVLDLGCGAGFPSIVLAIARPDLQIFALDSTEKKIRFVSDCAKRFEITNLTAITGRAEDSKVIRQLGTFDVIVSRAVARLNVLMELSARYCKIGGKLIAMKGAKGEEEYHEAKAGAITIGFGESSIERFFINNDANEEQRSFIILQKTSETPREYPRSYGQIIKKPL